LIKASHTNSTLSLPQPSVTTPSSAVNTASAIIRAISKPFLGKLSDIASRLTTYVVVLVVYAAAASSQTLVGKSGLDLLGDIIVGDLTPL
jgi:MFS family permease